MSAPSRKVRISVVVIVALSVVALVAVWVTLGEGMFGRRLHLRARFLDIYGLQEGDDVRFAGVQCGRVESIKVLPPSDLENSPTVEVTLNIYSSIGGRRATEVIRTDSTTTIRSADLEGKKLFVHITPGSALGQPVADRQLMPSTGPSTLGSFTSGEDELVRLKNEIRRISADLQELRDEKAGSNGESGSSSKPKAAETGRQTDLSKEPRPSPDYSKILERLEPGIILFDPPSKMTVGKTEQIQVRISKNASDELLKGLSESTEAQVAVVRKIGPTMRVLLKGRDFEIYPITNEEQVVTETEVTQWSWNVVPSRSGSHKLLILASVVLGDKQRDYPAYEKEISVSVNPLYSVQVFVGSNWQYILTTIIGSGVIGMILAWRKRNKPRPPSSWENP